MITTSIPARVTESAVLDLFSEIVWEARVAAGMANVGGQAGTSLTVHYGAGRRFVLNFTGTNTCLILGTTSRKAYMLLLAQREYVARETIARFRPYGA